jgi:hypothetical protein
MAAFSNNKSTTVKRANKSVPSTTDDPTATKLLKPKSTPSQTIGRFMNHTQHRRRSHYLQNICSDSGVCIAFGIENKKIKVFFNHFSQFDYVVPPIRSIGAVSANGFIKEINYQHQKYSANAILKSSQNPRADNLFYEYMVGLQVNQWTRSFPCFVETYGFYGYQDPYVYEWAKTSNIITDVAKFKQSLQLIHSSESTKSFEQNYVMVCQISQYLAILIQHIKNAKTFYDHYKTGKLPNIETLVILAQVYLPLGRLTQEFVHNDLHTNNVMLYEPAPGKFIEFHYHMQDGSVFTFKSYYIAKIIDYGRCFMPSAKNIYKDLCATKACNPQCGANVGFRWLRPSLTAANQFTSSTLRNPTQDLRLFHSIFPQLIAYGIGLDEKHAHYGSAPMNDSGLPQYIYNVADAAKYLEIFLISEKSVFENKGMYPANKKFGDLHIYMNMTTPMKFTPVYSPNNYTNV